MPLYIPAQPISVLRHRYVYSQDNQEFQPSFSDPKTMQLFVVVCVVVVLQKWYQENKC